MAYNIALLNANVSAEGDMRSKSALWFIYMRSDSSLQEFI